MKTLILTLVFLLVFSCNDNGNHSDVDFEWRGSPSVSYTYSGGVRSGCTWYNKFEVISGSGDIHLKFSVNGNKQKTETASVQEGTRYTVRTKISFSGCTSSASSTVKLSSTSVS
ncbi:hypothetical protein ACFL46_06280, partial [Candidatus Neomarinimicrobiota bacterium]